MRSSSFSVSACDRLLVKGVTCIYVSHRLEEIFAICDNVTVLRDGRLVSTVDVKSLNRDELIRMMIGRELAASLEEHVRVDIGEELLRVENLASPGKFQPVSFTLHAGEILGLAGLVGAGRTEIVEALFGLDREATGDVFVRGQKMSIRSPIQAMRCGFGLIPEDRNEAKRSKNFGLADQIRKDLDAEGIELRDTPEGTIWVQKTGLS